MTRSGSEVPPHRASDADREHAVRVLRDAAADGRLTHDSFVQRVDQALRARHDDSLAGLVADLTQPHALTRLLGGLASLADRVRPDATHPTLPLPGSSSPVVVIGRKQDCDFVITDDTTSRVHADLMLYAGRWYLTDHRSTNGTFVNGRRVWGTTAVRVGDLVSFGTSTFRLVRPTVPVSWSTPGPE